MSSLCTLSNDGSIVTLKELSEDEKASHLDIIDYASKLITIAMATQSLDSANREINDLVSSYLSESVSFGEFSTAITTKFDNFLTAVRGYVDKFSHTLSSKFGEDAKLFFENQKQKCFDCIFSYRLIEQLRNYCQHRATPVHSICSYMDGNEKKVGVYSHTKELMSDPKITKRHLA